ncbi:MAG TPA: hypothetical protein PKY82_29375 [Pyrinomonadaceae bacterium]|nr:hypothetical protein [Pyrinomonadaceae bacterium]
MEKLYLLNKILMLAVVALFAINQTMLIQTQRNISELLPELKIKNEVLKQGVGEDTQITVKLRNHNILEGYISQICDDTFILKNSETKEETIVAFKTVEEVKKVENSPEVELGIALISTTETVWSVIKAVSSEPEENN